jgi:hypothetical protein
MEHRSNAAPLAVPTAAAGDAAPSSSQGGTEVKKLMQDLAEVLSWIWMTPEQALALIRERDISWEIADARGAYAKAA